MLPSLLGAPCGCLAGWPEGVNVGGSVEAGSFLCLTGGTIPSSRPELCRASRASAVKPSPSETARSGLDGASTALNWLGLGSSRRLPVSRAGGEHGPGNAGGLGGLRQHRHLDRTAGEDAALPLGCAIGTRAGAADDRAGPQCQQLSEPDIALAANAALAALQAAGSPARGQARDRSSPREAWLSTLLIATNRMSGRPTAVQIAAASRASFLLRRTNGFT